MMNSIKRHVKIVATLGPASSAPEIIARLLLGGMNVARLNLSYGTLESHQQLIQEIRGLSKKLKVPAAVLLDLPGSKRRSGDAEALFGEHFRFAIAQGVDFLALSFITAAPQVQEARALLRQMKADIPIITKIERAGALQDSAAILEASDGLMVARGDLALEINIEKVPLAQKQLIREANRRGKPVITATQMLLSMVNSASPTRAEATDVANAVLDGTDALMLSEETTVGKYPVEAVETMVRIAVEAETGIPYLTDSRRGDLPSEVDDATARAACQMAQQLGAKAIVAFTTGGTTAYRLAKYRPHQPILAVTPYDTVLRRMSLVWGVHAAVKSAPDAIETVFRISEEVARESGVAQKSDLIIITCGLPLAVAGNTNLVKVHRL